MLREVESQLSACDTAILSAFGKDLLSRGFGMLLRSYREAGLRSAALEFDRMFALTEIGDLLELFCLGVPMPPKRVQAAIGPAVFEVLSRHNLLVRDDKGMIRTGGLRLIDHFGALLFVGALSSGTSLYFGPDSTALGSWLLGSSRGRCLDLCSGVGTQAILCARQSVEAVGVECNAEAIRVAHLNAALNGVSEGVRFYQGNVLDALSDAGAGSIPGIGRFDTVCSNPPLLPAPLQARLPLVADGGEDGLTFPACILPALPNLLEHDGRCYIIGTILGSHEGPDLSRIQDIAEHHGLRVFMVVPASLDIRRGEAFRSMLEATSMVNSSVHLEHEEASAAWDEVTSIGTHLYSFCLVASHADDSVRGGVEFTRHYQRNENFWYV